MSANQGEKEWVRTYKDCRVGVIRPTRNSGRAMDWMFCEVPGDTMWLYVEGSSVDGRSNFKKRGLVFTQFSVAMDHIRAHAWNEVHMHIYIPRGTPTSEGHRFLLVESVFESPTKGRYVYVTTCGQVFADEDIRLDRSIATNLKLVFGGQ